VAESRFVVTTSPGFEGDARRELKKLLPGAEASGLLMKGNVLLTSPLPRKESLQVIREAVTYHVASVVPFDTTVRVNQTVESLEPLKTCLPWHELFAEPRTFVIRCRRRGGHQWQTEHLKRLLGMHIEKTSKGIAVLVGETERVVGVDVYQEVAYVGVYEPEDHLIKKLVRHRKYGFGERRPLNRSELKLREALAAFDVATDESMRALDVGAAPGGWTTVLAERVGEVIAVDPGDLAPEVAELPNVRHLKAHAEDIELEDVGPVDLLVNDMNIEGPDSAAVMNAIAPILKPEGRAIMTVKLFSPRWHSELSEAKRALRSHYRILDGKRLPHNGSESTLLLRRK